MRKKIVSLIKIIIKYKYLILLVVTILFLVVFFMWIFRDKSYEISYKVNGYDINELYNDSKKYYYVNISYDSVKYQVIYEEKYINEEIISSVKKYDEDEDVCLVIKSEFDENILCSSSGELIDNNLVNDSLKEKLNIIDADNQLLKKDNNLELYNKFSNSIYVWNYNGFDIIKNGEIESVDIFDNDVYDSSLIGFVDGYFVMPNYNEEFNFNEFIFMDSNNKLSTFDSDYTISENSYIIGSYEKSIFYADVKNETIYEIVPDKNKIRIYGTISSTVDFLVDGVFEKISVKEIINNKLSFTFESNYEFILEDNSLYLSILSNDPIRISDKSVNKIISFNNDEVIYLVDNELYYFYSNEKLLITKDEWLFNSDNKIFIVFD